MDTFPLGKLPPQVLENLLDKIPMTDTRVLLGPGIGLDCAVIDFGDQALVVKSDPITFTSEQIGWYAVHINANDIATTGARPKWFLATILLPEKRSDEALVSLIFQQIEKACFALRVTLVGGHTEITSQLDRPIVVGTMIGETRRDRLITPRGAHPGDRLLLTKGIPIEATSILARDLADRLQALPARTLNRARDYLTDPGISVVSEAIAAATAGGVTAMHDPTEGGLASGLWELSRAAQVGLIVDREAIPIPVEARQICDAFAIDPLEAIASGALLLSVEPDSAQNVMTAIEAVGVTVAEIGMVQEGEQVILKVEEEMLPLPFPQRDAIAYLFEAHDADTL